MTLRSLFLAAAVAAATAFPAAANAAVTTASQPVRETLDATFTTPHSAGGWTGKLDLTVYPDGIIQGYYRPNDGRFITVTGGESGDRVWLAFGMGENFTVTGTIRNGKIQAGALLPYGRELDLTATPHQA